MGLINVPLINNLDAATPDLFNSRYGTIVNAINGNLDNTNISAGGVSTSNLAASSITTAKINDAAVTPPKWTNPYKFSVYRNAGFTASGGTVVMDTKIFDTGTNFSTTTGLYTVPVNGFYFFSGYASTAISSNQSWTAGLTFTGSRGSITETHSSGLSGTGTVGNGGTATGLYQLVAGDTVGLTFYASGNAGSTGVVNNGFSGFLVTIT